MIFKLGPADSVAILSVINDAAQAYKGAIPNDCWHEPYMPAEELAAEIGAGVQFHGWVENGELVAVMGIQSVKDVTLIRHAYVKRSNQRRGIGEKLLRHLISLAKTQKLYVGTWTAAWWAVQFYQKNGFTLVPLERTQTRAKLRQYWNISDRHAEASLVLRFQK